MRGEEVKREELHRIEEGGNVDYDREIDEFHRDSFVSTLITGNGS